MEKKVYDVNNLIDIIKDYSLNLHKTTFRYGIDYIKCDKYLKEKHPEIFKELEDYFIPRKVIFIYNTISDSMYPIKGLVEIGIPITFDYWHHTFNTGGLSEEEAFFMARETWQRHGITQCTHYSESRRHESQRLIEGICNKHNIALEDLPKWPTFNKMYIEFGKIKAPAHADYITQLPNTYGVDDLDIMVEAKAKEQALKKIGVECCQLSNKQLIV